MSERNFEIDAAVRVPCPGTGGPVTNITRAWVGRRLPVVGTCSVCFRKVEATREWTAKYHRVTTVYPPASPQDGPR